MLEKEISCSKCNININDEHKHCEHKNHDHDHHHDHNHEFSLEYEKEVKFFDGEMVSYFIGLIMLVGMHFIDIDAKVKFLIYVAMYIIAGREILLNSAKNIRSGDFLDENFLMTIASIGAFVVGQYPEAISVVLLFNIGEKIEDLALNKSRKSISQALLLKPDFANLSIDGEIKKVKPEMVEVGNIIYIKPGEKVPLDGIIIDGAGYVNTANITGEPVPVKLEKGDNIFSGYINKESLLKVKVLKKYDEGMIAKILELVENAASRKAPIEKFITKFARVYTPVVVLFAIAMVIVPPVFGWISLRDAIFRACTFLVISCPCALVISVPLGLFSGIGKASKNGIFVKGGNYLESLADVSDIVFDKTGTVTKGVFEVSEIYSELLTDSEMIEMAAYGEYNSTHPIAKAILSKYGKKVDIKYITNYEEIPGKGVSYELSGDRILLGNEKFMDSNNIEIKKPKSIGTYVYMARNDKFLGYIVVSDILKDNIKSELSSLKKFNANLSMLSGDEDKNVRKIAKSIGIDNAYGGLLPEGKVDILEKIIKNAKGKVVFVGDGVNDAPVIARADIGVAMGGIGSDSAVEAADIVLMKDEIGRLKQAMEISRHTKKIVYFNIAFALFVKFSVLILGVFGFASMWAAVFADVGVSVICILNAVRK